MVPELEEIAKKSREKVWSCAAVFRGRKRGYAVMTGKHGAL